jgi:spore maturation protein SpmA
MLNIIWTSFFVLSFIAAAVQSLYSGDAAIFSTIVDSLFATATSAFQLALNLTGMLCLWLGFLHIAEKSGLTELLSKALRPLFRIIMPDVPENSPAFGSIVMNMAANILGLEKRASLRVIACDKDIIPANTLLTLLGKIERHAIRHQERVIG